MTADNEFVCYVNGRRVGAGRQFHSGLCHECRLGAEAGRESDRGGCHQHDRRPNPAGLIGLLSIKLRDGRTIQVPTDQSWEAADESRAKAGTPGRSRREGWAAAMELGPLGMAPWGDIEGSPNCRRSSRTPRSSMIGWPTAEAFRRISIPRAGTRSATSIAGSARRTSTSWPTARRRVSRRTASFRVAGKQPELWHPESGRIAPLAAYEEKDGCTLHARCGSGRRNRCSSSSGIRPTASMALSPSPATDRICLPQRTSPWRRERWT